MTRPITEEENLDKDLYDLIIIGGGPTGIHCGIEAKRQGLKFLIIEKGVLANSIYNFPSEMTFFSTSLKLEIANVPFISHADKPTRTEALEYYRRLTDFFELNIRLFEEVELVIKDKKNIFEVKTNRSKYKSKYIIVATGFFDTPRLLNIPGENLSKVSHYYNSAHPYFGQKLAIIGAANSACDVALEAFSKGSTVTMIIREQELYQKVKYWIRPNIDNRIASGEVIAYFNSYLKEIKEKSIIFEDKYGNTTEIENDFVLAMTGYIPNYQLLNRLMVPIREDEYRTPEYNEETFETKELNLYVAGVVNAGMETSKLFIENTRHHAPTIIANILNKEK